MDAAHPGRGWLRLLRTTALAATVTGLGLAAHVSGGGGLPVAAAVAAAASVGLASVGLAARRVSVPRLLALTLAAQGLFHLLLGGGHHPMAPDGRMLLAHAGAAGLTAVLLARADAVLHVVVARLRRRPAGLRRVRSRPRPWAPSPRPIRVPVLTPARLVPRLRFRGPPAAPA